MEPGQSNYPIIMYADGGSGEGLLIGKIPKNATGNNSGEEQIIIMLRPHGNMENTIKEYLKNISLDDTKRRYGDYPILRYPMSLKRTLSMDPSNTVYFLKCDIYGTPIDNLGLEDEQFSVISRIAATENKGYIDEIAKLRRRITDLTQQDKLLKEIKLSVTQIVSSEMRAYLSKEKKSD